MRKMAVINQSTNRPLAEAVMVAQSFFTRARGLLGRRALKKGEGLYIAPCTSIHTWFMGFAIDVLFLDKSNRVTRIVTDLKPFRVAIGPSGSVGVLELAKGSLLRDRCRVGDEIGFASV